MPGGVGGLLSDEGSYPDSAFFDKCIFPIIRISMEIHNGKYEYVVGIYGIKSAIRESFR
jgi:hypothetical protein